MTESANFGRLEDVSLRSAWGHEALDFTPWLAANLDRLSEAIGIPLELVEQEARVTSFAADILARNPSDDTLVLIENQLEDSDHTHLGQIMTYLAGLSARLVVWIAPGFREAHLSAIKWLNENTDQTFAFFAVKVRVVRIGDSPLAPLFDVVERPNNWERSVQERAREAREPSGIGQFRRDFWTHLAARYPAELDSGAPNALGYRWRKPSIGEFVVVQYLGSESVGVFIRGERGASQETSRAMLAPYVDALTQRLGAPIAGGIHGFVKSLRLDTRDRANWDRMADWLHEQADKYVATLKDVVEGNN